LRITRDDEFERHTWLAAMVSHSDKLHFTYKTGAFEKSGNQTGVAARQHYVRYDEASGQQELDVYPEFRGEQLVIRGSHSLLAARSAVANSPLYCVGYEAPWMTRCRLVCLASDDNGRSWYDYAVSQQQFMPTGLGGCRKLTEDGLIIGSFTDLVDVDELDDLDMFADRHGIYFFKIQAGRAKAKVERRGAEQLRFTKVRGQPQQIRFQSASQTWSDWIEFQPEMDLPADGPIAFQLRSSLGVQSAEFPLAAE
jgi:hypothetical protein